MEVYLNTLKWENFTLFFIQTHEKLSFDVRILDLLLSQQTRGPVYIGTIKDTLI